MAVTYQALSSTTLGSASSTVTFSSISQTYTDLVLVATFGAMSEVTAFRFRFNSDSGSNYSYLQLSDYGPQSTKDVNQTSGLISGSLGNTTDRNVFVMNIQNYSNTTTYKTTINRGAKSDATQAATSICASTWRSTSAVTSVSLSPNFAGGVNFPIGSIFSLYGIKAA